MRILLSILIISCVTKFSYAIKCSRCEISALGETCDLPSKCPKGVESCETLVSKVNGNYSIVLDCATKGKCVAEPIVNGLKKCKYDETSTECYTCCDEPNCNTLEAALEHLPQDIFGEAKAPKKAGKKNHKKLDVEDNEVIEKDAESTEESEELAEEETAETEEEESAETTELDEVENDDNLVEIDGELKKSMNNKEKVELEKSEVEGTNETLEVPLENPEVFNTTVLENAPAVNVTENTTANATVEGTANNNSSEVVAVPLDPNVQAIDKKLNETVVEEDLFENADFVDDEDTKIKVQTEEEADEANQANMEEKKVDTGIVYENADVGMGTKNNNGEEINILKHGENAEDSEEFIESASDYSKLSNALLALSAMIFFIRLL